MIIHCIIYSLSFNSIVSHLGQQGNFQCRKEVTIAIAVDAVIHFHNVSHDVLAGIYLEREAMYIYCISMAMLQLSSFRNS